MSQTPLCKCDLLQRGAASLHYTHSAVVYREGVDSKAEQQRLLKCSSMISPTGKALLCRECVVSKRCAAETVPMQQHDTVPTGTGLCGLHSTEAGLTGHRGLPGEPAAALQEGRLPGAAASC